jgi:hypothetical protein
VNGFKSFITSKTYWGIGLSAYAAARPQDIAAVFALFGVTNQAMLMEKLAVFVGLIIAAYGRWVAKKKLTLTGNPPDLK